MHSIPSTSKDISLDEITIGITQARQRDTKVESDDDLVLSIKEHGLLSPIVVRKMDDGQYELLVGQRRLRAHEHLKRKTIKAHVIENVGDYEAKMLSVIENVARKDMKHMDLVDAVQFFMEKYNTTKDVAEHLGLHPSTVRKYINMGRLPVDIRTDIRNNDYKMTHALKALKALGDDETSVDTNVLRETALEIKKLSPQTQKKFIEIKTKEPNSTTEQVSEKAKQRTSVHHMNFIATDDQRDRITKYKNREDIDDDDQAVGELVDLGLDATDV